jgi:hypothetical protein
MDLKVSFLWIFIFAQIIDFPMRNGHVALLVEIERANSFGL